MGRQEAYGQVNIQLSGAHRRRFRSPRCSPTSPTRRTTSTALGEITVTADRIDEPVNSIGSDVTVIPGSQVQQWGANGITEVLREALA